MRYVLMAVLVKNLYRLPEWLHGLPPLATKATMAESERRCHALRRRVPKLKKTCCESESGEFSRRF